jgi:hypothetical protein
VRDAACPLSTRGVGGKGSLPDLLRRRPPACLPSRAQPPLTAGRGRRGRTSGLPRASRTSSCARTAASPQSSSPRRPPARPPARCRRLPALRRAPAAAADASRDRQTLAVLPNEEVTAAIEHGHGRGRRRPPGPDEPLEPRALPTWLSEAGRRVVRDAVRAPPPRPPAAPPAAPSPGARAPPLTRAQRPLTPPRVGAGRAKGVGGDGRHVGSGLARDPRADPHGAAGYDTRDRRRAARCVPARPCARPDGCAPSVTGARALRR